MNLTVTISVNDGPSVGVKTQARDMAETQIRPALERARQALQAEIDALETCPYHQPTPDATRTEQVSPPIREDKPHG